MPRTPGDRLGPFELLSPLGVGGMGEGWKGRDTRLDRIVAIKFSHAKFSERFEREARAVAALNHPNICQLYDIGPDYLVLEYVEGSPVAPQDNPRKLLDIATQIADGMAAAHSAGFTHRDLKPDNILITREGRVKILDFGLAKHATTISETDATLTMALTDPGTVLGTVAYMSPEQARGQSTDTRSDQFSFGLIVYELAASKRAFKRDSAAETMAAIIKDDAPPLEANIPAPLRWIIERCLAKDPAERYDSTRDLYRELRQVKERLSDITFVAPDTAPLPAPTPRRSSKLPWLLAAALTVAIAALLFWPLPPSEPAQVTPFATEANIQAMPRWSPKGDRIAYVADVSGVLQIFTRSLGSSTPTQITHEPESALNPMWSGDGSRIYYETGVRPGVNLRSIAVAGGTPVTLLKNVFQAKLSPDGKTLAIFVSDSPGTYRLAFASPPEAPPKPYSVAPFADLRTPGVATYTAFDPSGEHLAVSTLFGAQNQFWTIPLDGGAPQEEVALRGLSQGDFMLDGRGQIIMGPGPSTPSSQLASIQTNSGNRRLVTAESTRQMFPVLAPDTQTLAFTSGEMGYDVVEFPLDGSAPREVVATTRTELSPAWAPDGVRFAYTTDRGGGREIWLRNRINGSETRITGEEQFPGGSFLDLAISPDGGRVAYRAARGGGAAIWISPLSGEAPVRLWDNPDPQRGPSWSPDGNTIAYYGIHDGSAQVMTIGVGSAAPPKALATMNRLNPVRWSPRGDWILYRDGDVLKVVSPDGKQNRELSQLTWETFGWSKDGARIVGIARGANRRLLLQQIEIDSRRESRIADLGPVPPEFDLADPLNEFAYRGFSLHPDGKSFLTSVLRIKTGIYLMKDFDRPQRLIDRLR